MPLHTVGSCLYSQAASTASTSTSDLRSISLGPILLPLQYWIIPAQRNRYLLRSWQTAPLSYRCPWRCSSKSTPTSKTALEYRSNSAAALCSPPYRIPQMTGSRLPLGATIPPAAVFSVSERNSSLAVASVFYAPFKNPIVFEELRRFVSTINLDL